jgi:hypothetical protein
MRAAAPDRGAARIPRRSQQADLRNLDLDRIAWLHEQRRIALEGDAARRAGPAIN